MKDDNTKKYEERKNILIKRSEQASENLRLSRENNEAIDRIRFYEKQVEILQAQIEFLRPQNKEDVEYRMRQYRLFPKLIKQNVPDNLPLCFHGCPIYATNHIIEEGLIRSHEDRLESSTGYDVSVTTRKDIETTVQGYANLWNEFFELPAGCIFVILPKDESEIARSETSNYIGNVNFKEEPERLYSIITTPENIERISQWAKKAGIDLSKIHDYDSFIKEIQSLQNYDLSQSSIMDRIQLVICKLVGKIRRLISQKNIKQLHQGNAPEQILKESREVMRESITTGPVYAEQDYIKTDDGLAIEEDKDI